VGSSGLSHQLPGVITRTWCQSRILCIAGQDSKQWVNWSSDWQHCRSHGAVRPVQFTTPGLVATPSVFRCSRVTKHDRGSRRGVKGRWLNWLRVQTHDLQPHSKVTVNSKRHFWTYSRSHSRCFHNNSNTAFHPCLDLSCGLFRSGFPKKFCINIQLLCALHAPPKHVALRDKFMTGAMCKRDWWKVHKINDWAHWIITMLHVLWRTVWTAPFRQHVHSALKRHLLCRTSGVKPLKCIQGHCSLAGKEEVLKIRSTLVFKFSATFSGITSPYRTKEGLAQSEDRTLDLASLK